MADLFSIKRKIKKYEDEKVLMDLLRSIVDAFDSGKKNFSAGYPTGLSIEIVNMIRSYGFKVHTIELKDPQIKDAKTTIIQW